MNNYMEIKWITWKNWQILRKVQSSRTEPGRNRNYEQPNYKHWNWSCDQKSPKKQKPRTRGLHRRILLFREELMPILLKHFQKIAEEGALPNSFYKATIALIQKSDKDNTKTDTCRQMSLMNIVAKVIKKTSKQNSATHQTAHTPWSSWVYSRNARIL